MKNSTKIAVNEFVRLLGGTKWTRTASRCTGKWSGTTDYGILIDEHIHLFVSNGMAGFETRVREWIASFKTFQVKKDYYLELLREQARRDNATAISEGLYPVHVLFFPELHNMLFYRKIFLFYTNNVVFLIPFIGEIRHMLQHPQRMIDTVRHTNFSACKFDRRNLLAFIHDLDIVYSFEF